LIASSREPGLRAREDVDLVKEWGWERARRFVLCGWRLSFSSTEAKKVILSDPEELTRFFEGFRHAILGVQRYMTGIGAFGIESGDGGLHEGEVLIGFKRRVVFWPGHRARGPR
jgi:hypothetical protein